MPLKQMILRLIFHGDLRYSLCFDHLCNSKIAYYPTHIRICRDDYQICESYIQIKSNSCNSASQL